MSAAPSGGWLTSLPVVLDRAGPLEIFEEDRLDIEHQLDLVADDHAAAGNLVLPRDAEIVAIDPGAGLEADPAHVALVLVALPERCHPLAEVVDVERNCPRRAADREVDVALEGGVGGALAEAPGERDPGMVLYVEEVGAA